MLQRVRWTRYFQVTAMLCGYLGGLGSSWAQDPSPAPGSQPVSSRPTNLKVLPKDISAAELDRLMKQYRDELGVSCGYCHVENPRTQTLDYASDENSTKETARLMIVMLKEINGKYLSRLDDTRYAVTITCGNCHLGQSTPPAYEPK